MRLVNWTSAAIVPLAATPLAVVLLWLASVPLAPLSLMMIAAIAAALLATHQAMAAADHTRSLDELRQAVESGRPEIATALPRDIAALRDAMTQQLDRARDSTERSAEQAQRLAGTLDQLRIELAQTRSAIDLLGAAVIVTDALDEVVLASTAAATLLDQDASKMERQPLAGIQGLAPLAHLVREARQSETAAEQRVARRVTLGPGMQSCDVRLRAVECPHTRGRLGVVALIEPDSALSAARRQDADLVACMSHELRTPLSSIRAYLEMLMDGEAADEVSRSQFYAIIEGETNRLMRLIDNVLGLNRVEAGLGVMQKQVTDLAGLVTEAFELIQPQSVARRITMRLDPMPAAPVYVDRDLMVQVVTNLLGNAIKYTATGGTVSVRLALDTAGGVARVSITDTGVGIPAADLPHIFERFYRVRDHRRIASGTGLGLALVRQVVETLHAGRVEVQSEVGQGSTFTFTLPIAEEG